MMQPRHEKEHKTYISGKVQGIPIENIEKKFKSAERYLKTIGMIPINPLVNGLNESKTEQDHLINDLPLLLGSNSIFILDNWFDSKQSRIELKIAQEYGITVMYESAILKNMIKTEKIKEAIFDVLGFRFEQYTTNSRERHFFYARMIFINYCREVQDITLEEIGIMLNRDHSTVLHGIKQFKNEIQYNMEFREDCRKINEILSK